MAEDVRKNHVGCGANGDIDFLVGWVINIHKIHSFHTPQKNTVKLDNKLDFK